MRSSLLAKKGKMLLSIVHIIDSMPWKQAKILCLYKLKDTDEQLSYLNDEYGQTNQNIHRIKPNVHFPNIRHLNKEPPKLSIKKNQADGMS